MPSGMRCERRVYVLLGLYDYFYDIHRKLFKKMKNGLWHVLNIFILRRLIQMNVKKYFWDFLLWC